MPTDGAFDAFVALGDEPFLAERTRRALARQGVTARVLPELELVNALARAERPAWIVRAGFWPQSVPMPRASATGKALLGLGAALGDDLWSRFIAESGGEATKPPPSLPSVLVERPAALFAGATNLDICMMHAIEEGAVRAVRLPALDVRGDARLRVAQVITTLHRGGAERIAIELHRSLASRGVTSALYVLERPQREAYPEPPGVIAIHEIVRTREARQRELILQCEGEAWDALHVHLLDGDTIRALTRAGFPIVTTLHNAARAWPPGVSTLTQGELRLAIACSAEVAGDARENLSAPLRTAWNGVAETRAKGVRADTRRALEASDDALVVVTIANPRPQKRLELGAAAIARVASVRPVVWVIAGAPLAASDDARAATVALDAAIAANGITHLVRRLGSVAEPRALLEAADVALSTSAWEGFSVAHLEALAAGVPLVTTRVGGTHELEALAGVHVADDPTPEVLASALEAARRGPRPTLPPELGLDACAQRHEALYRRVAAPRARREGPLWLVTNNFSIGGAQASARRLLLGLRARGVDARAIVVEEQRAFPTPWRAALEADGVPIVVPNRRDTEASVLRSLEAIDAGGAQAVIFWNAITEHKVRLADALLDVPVFDVSPGEMYFASLERYFANPRRELPYRTPMDYGRLLSGMVVKFEGEAARAKGAVGAEISVIPNGVPLRERSRQRSPSDVVRVGSLARISPDKKLELLIDASLEAARRTSLRFEIAVAGPIERGADAYAAELAARAAGSPVRFVGTAESEAFLDDLNLFAMVSEPEVPNASLEAMASGLAVVATDAGGAREQLESGVSGLLVPRWDRIAFGQAIARLVEDAPLRARLGEGAKARVRSAFAVETMVDRWLALVSRSASSL